MNRNTSITLAHHLEERKNKLAALRSALIAGEKSGFVEYSLQELMSDLNKEESMDIEPPN